CSTSGGNKAYGTDIQTAFRKAILARTGDQIACPGINIRQVWARMASQLIVKSEAALNWGGKTIWVVQDALTDYIRKNTGLRLQEMKSGMANEVNIISASGRSDDVPMLFSGPISVAASDEASFSDILRAPFLPDINVVLSKLSCPPTGSFIVPEQS
ncbi:MAG: hypothetical protein RLY97_890, partial [Pseudomonadota bacterium]